MKTQEEMREYKREYNRLWRARKREELENELARKKELGRIRFDKIRSGYPLGRPRKGEVRPPSIGGIAQAKYRADNPDLSAERNRIAQSKWYAENSEKRLVQAKAYRLRKKGWDKLKSIEKVEKQINKARKAADKGPPKYKR